MTTVTTKHKCPDCDRLFKSSHAAHVHHYLAHKRKKNGKKLGQPRKKRTPTMEVSVNFCPQCGCNLNQVAIGIAMAKTN